MGKIEIIEVAAPLSRLEVILQTWAYWMRRGGSFARGYPIKACGFAEYGSNSVEDMEDTSDEWLARSIDAIIRDLPNEENNAIHHQYLDSRYRFRIVFYAPTLRNAKRLIQEAMSRKGVW